MYIKILKKSVPKCIYYINLLFPTELPVEK